MRAWTALLLTIFTIPVVCAGRPDIDLYKNISSFSGERGNYAFPNLDLLEDSANNKIGNACLAGATRSQLRKLGISDLDARIQKLLAGSVLVLRNDKYFLGIPAIIGGVRTELATIVDKKAHLIAPQVASILNRILEATPGNGDMAFHLLWSRVMDEMWYQTWQLDARPGKGPPLVDWIIYPEHPQSFGTNSWNQDIAITWSQHTSCRTLTVQDSRLVLMKTAWGQTIDINRNRELQGLGLLDHEGHFRGFAIHSGDPIDKLLKQLTAEYAHLVASAYDYEELTKRWHVPSDQLWVILMHETAYSVFEDLIGQGKLKIPGVLTGSGNLLECRSAVSLLLERPITYADEIEDLFRKTGWLGSQEVIDQAKNILEHDPNNPDVLYFVGLSLYQVKNYPEALNTFQHLSEISSASGNPRQLISHLWMGHVLDIQGEREKAIHEYQIVIASPQADSTINYSGYHIGPTTLRTWAAERIKSPYKRQ